MRAFLTRMPILTFWFGNRQESQMHRPRICFLPVAGKEDPGQLLRMQGLRDSGQFEVIHGVHARFFAGIRTCLKYHPDFLYFDWIARYHHGRTSLVTAFKIFAFMIDVKVVTKIFRCPVVWSLHNLHSHESASFFNFEGALQRYFARHVSVVRVFSASSVDRACIVLGIDRGKIRVVPEGDFSNFYPNVILSEEARLRLNLAREDLVLLWLGSIRPYKGLHELITTFQKCARSNWRLVIAGKPFIASYAWEISALVQGDSRIQLHERFIPEDELQVFYNAADAVVLPFAEVENSGSVCMAMGFRKPVVAPALGVIGERLCHQPDLVYPPGGLSNALAVLAALPAARIAQIGELNYKEIRGYAWTNLARVFTELLASQEISATRIS